MAAGQAAGADVRSRAPLLSSVQLSSRGRPAITSVPPARLARNTRSCPVGCAADYVPTGRRDVCTGPTAVTAVNWAHAGNHLTSCPVEWSTGQYSSGALASTHYRHWRATAAPAAATDGGEQMLAKRDSGGD